MTGGKRAPFGDDGEAVRPRRAPRRRHRGRCGWCGTESRPRVADIVAAAGLSNDAFYRHFASKDALVAAILEDGTERLGSYVAHQMEARRPPQGKVRRWVEGVLSQAADDEIASTTLAVLWNAGSIRGDPASGPPLRPGHCCASRSPSSAAPTRISTPSLAAHATVGQLARLAVAAGPAHPVRHRPGGRLLPRVDRTALSRFS